MIYQSSFSFDYTESPPVWIGCLQWSHWWIEYCRWVLALLHLERVFTNVDHLDRLLFTIADLLDEFIENLPNEKLFFFVLIRWRNDPFDALPFIDHTLQRLSSRFSRLDDRRYEPFSVPSSRKYSEGSVPDMLELLPRWSLNVWWDKYWNRFERCAEHFVDRFQSWARSWSSEKFWSLVIPRVLRFELHGNSRRWSRRSDRWDF